MTDTGKAQPRAPAGQSTTQSMPAGESAAASKKRNRIRFSCTTCREKKLKCNRAQPCDQCVKRNITGTCIYMPYSYPRDALRAHTANTQRSGRSPQMEASPQERLRYHERMVAELRRQANATASEETSTSRGQPQNKRNREPRPPGMPETPGDLSGVLEPTPAGSLVGDLRFVDGANWEAILEDVTNLTGALKTEEDDGDEDGFVNDFSGLNGPVLISGSWPQLSVTEMMYDMPPRPITDRLIARFFRGKEPAWMMFHLPSFMRHYERFWEAPHEFSKSWVGLLFIMIAHAALFCLRGDEEVPGNLGAPMSVCNAYRIRSAHALALDDYTKPGKWKIEAMILYFGIEYLRLSDAQRGTSIILTIIVRLGMHSGLHRDPTHYKDISVFECEMRRRLWTLLTEIEVLVAFQFGLPPCIQLRFCDTQLPKNYLDEDFDETTTEWPAERPHTDRTPALYTIVKSHIAKAFSNILATVTASESPTYGEVLRLDQKLEAAHDAIPPLLRMKPFSTSILDPIDLIMQRLWIELMYQKARIVLHRRYFAAARADNRYRFSHFACIDASTRILQHQFDIHNEMLPGGRLSKERWFLSSLSTHDFLLANMMLCLELSHVLTKEDPQLDIGSPGPIEKDRLLNIINTSRNIWQARCDESAEATRAFKILSRMLTISTGVQYDVVPDAASPEASVDATQRPAYQFAQGMDPRNFAEMQSQQQQQFEAPAQMQWVPGMVPVGAVGGAAQEQWTDPVAPMPMPEVMVDAGPGLDWATWDTQILNAPAESMEIPWTNFFRPS